MRLPCRRHLPALALAGRMLTSTSAHAQIVALDPLVVSATRAPTAISQVANSVTVLSADQLTNSPSLTSDGTLRSVPSFSLFRRNDSLTANPTTQGVSLRGLGPSGASRSLVLWDGLPLNDPFGGWIPWSEIPRDGIDRVEIVPGGGASAWGNTALGGVIALYSPAPAAGGSLSVWGGDFATRGAELREAVPLGPGFFQISAQDFATNGTLIIAPGERGSIDTPAASNHHWISSQVTEPLGRELTVTLSGRLYNEWRDNGTPYQQNTTRSQSGALQVESHYAGAFNWSAAAYAEDEVFTSTFSSINAARTSETPASIQFDVPASATGAEWSGTWTETSGARTTAGTDYRQVRGETREDYQYTSGSFTRQRFAGGEQAFAGLFLLRDQPLAAGLRASAGARLDYWDQSEGHRRETDLGTGAVLRDDHDPERDGTEFSPSLGLIWQAAPMLRLRASGQLAFRAPTLNELYRPFRQGTDVTEANPALRNEQVTTGELAADFTAGAFSATLSGFVNELRHSVANVTLAQGPSTTELFGTLPPGGTGRERMNLDRVQVRGLEASARWTVAKPLTFEAAAILDNARVEAAAPSPQLVDKRLAEVPRVGASLGATYRPVRRLTLQLRLRYIGRQFDDDLNQLPLAAALVTNLGVRYQVTLRLTAFLDVDNLADKVVETSHSVAGVYGQDSPRLAFGGLRFGW